jgi:Piwi domain
VSEVQDLAANVLPAEFTADRFGAWVRDIAEGEDLVSLRRAHAPEWSVQWERGRVYFLPVARDIKAPSGTARTDLQVRGNLRLLARLTTEALIRRFPDYEPLRRKPFTFLGRRRQLMSNVAQDLGISSAFLDEFRIWPKYSLDARVMEILAGSPFIGVTVDLATRWEITSGLESLQEAGVDLTGLFVVRRLPDPDQRALVGRISAVRDGKVELSESTSEAYAVETNSVMLEGRRDAFARCLKHLLGKHYTRYDEYRDTQMGDLLRGQAFLEEVRRVATVIRSEPLELAAGLTCSVGSPLAICNTGNYKSIVTARRLDYCFDAARSKRREYAWPGLEKYGPFSRETFARPSPRILVFFPHAAQGAAEQFICRLRDGMAQSGAFQAGLAKTFGLVNPRFEPVPVRASSQPPAERYRNAVLAALGHGELPDAALVIMTDHDGDLPDTDNPYLHSKAILLMAGVPTQHIRLSTIAARPNNLQYVLQNVSVALYAKMKGIPWTVDQDLTIADELVIGIGTAELTDSRIEERQRYVGITTVFRGDGNYLLSQLTREAAYAEYPGVLRDSARDLISEIKARNGWQPGDTVRIVLHAARPPRNTDFALLMRDAVMAAGDEQHIEFAFVTVSHEHPFALFDPSARGKPTPKGRKGEYAPDRGLIVQTEKYARLITTTGPSLVKRAGLPLPRPLHVHLHRHSTFTDLHYLSEQVLKFTALSWRSTQPAADPVTIYYSELIARQLARLRAVPGWSPALLDARLRTSKWFL